MSKNGYEPKEESRVSSSPQHGVLFGETGVPIYRLAAVEYYVERKKRLYEAVLSMPKTWIISLLALVICLCTTALCMLRESSVRMPALLISSSSVPDSNAMLLVLPAVGYPHSMLFVGRGLVSSIDGKLQTLKIMSIGAAESSDEASRQLHIASGQTRSIASIVTVVKVEGPATAEPSTKRIWIVRSIRLIDLLKG